MSLRRTGQTRQRPSSSTSMMCSFSPCQTVSVRRKPCLSSRRAEPVFPRKGSAYRRRVFSCSRKSPSARVPTPLPVLPAEPVADEAPALVPPRHRVARQLPVDRDRLYEVSRVREDPGLSVSHEGIPLPGRELRPPPGLRVVFLRQEHFQVVHRSSNAPVRSGLGVCHPPPTIPGRPQRRSGRSGSAGTLNGSRSADVAVRFLPQKAASSVPPSAVLADPLFEVLAIAERLRRPSRVAKA